MAGVRRRLVPPPLAAAIALTVASVGCGGASTGARSTTPGGEPCAAEIEAAQGAADALAACRAAPPAAWSHGATYDELVARLDAYERSLVLGDDGAEAAAQEIAGACWTFFDELAAEVVDHAPLDAAEDAAEALLRDRAHDRAVEAVAAARSALAHLFELYAAPSAPDCTEAEADDDDARDALDRCRVSAPD